MTSFSFLEDHSQADRITIAFWNSGSGSLWAHDVGRAELKS
jgi:hypothetical protein